MHAVDNTNHEFLHGGEPCFPHFSRTASSQSLLHGNLRKWWKGVWSLTRPVLQKLLMVETKPHVWSLVKSMGTDRIILKWYSIAALDQVNTAAFLTNPFHIQVHIHIVYVAPWWILVSSTSISKSYRDIFLLYMLMHILYLSHLLFWSAIFAVFELQNLHYTHFLDDKLRRLQICSEFFAYMAWGSFDKVLAIFSVWQSTFNLRRFFGD